MVREEGQHVNPGQRLFGRKEQKQPQTEANPYPSPVTTKKDGGKEQDRVTKRRASMEFSVNAKEALGTQSSAESRAQGDGGDPYIPSRVSLSY